MSYRLSGEVLIRRSPDEVFDVVADETNEPAYNPAMRSAEKLTSGPVGVGTRFEAVMGRGRRSYPMRTEITGFDRPHRLASHTTMAGMEVEGAVTFTPVGDRTRLRWEWDVAPRGWLRLIAPFVRRFSDGWEAANWHRLAEHLERSGQAADG